MWEGRGQQHGGHSKKQGPKKGFVGKFFSVSKIFSSSFQSSTISKISTSCKGAPPCQPALLDKASSSSSYRRHFTGNVVVLDSYVQSDGTLLRGSRSAPSEDETEEESQQHDEEDSDFDAHECLDSDSADRPVTPKATAVHIQRYVGVSPPSPLAQPCGKDTEDARDPCGPCCVVQPPVHAAGAVASQFSPDASETSHHSVLAAKVTSVLIDEKQDVLRQEQEGGGGVPRASDTGLSLPQLECCAGHSASLCVSPSAGRVGTQAVVAEVVTKPEGCCQEHLADPQHAPSSAPSSPSRVAADAAATIGPTEEGSRCLAPTAKCPLPPRQRKKKLRPVLVPRLVSESSVVEGEEDVRAWFAPSPNFPPLPPGAYMCMQSGRCKSGAEEPPDAWLDEFWNTSSS